jgi:hypothetical protein
MQFTHITINVTINEEDRAWGNPNGSESLSFSVPSDLFDATKISKLFPSIIKIAEERFMLDKQKAELEVEGE